MANNYRPRRTKEELEDALVEAESVVDVIRALGLKASGGNHAQVKKMLWHYGLEIPKFDNTKHPPIREKKTDDEVFCQGSTYNRFHLKKRLLDIGFDYKCSMDDCLNPNPVWRGQPLTLHLDHINGVNDDNRLENLRFLCPNCHTQTDTYAGRNRTHVPKSYVCSYEGCEESITKNANMCSQHSTLTRYGNEWPEDEVLVDMVNRLGYSGAAREIGTVSDNSVKKRYKKIISRL